MLIKQLFEKDIDRRIDGVVKADQLDQESLWIELDEFVVTAEVRRHLLAFFDAVKDSIDAPNDPAVAGRNGVWLSGFFGSGKSMLLKIVSLMMENKPISAHGRTQTPLEFILPKLRDPLAEQTIAACCGGGVQSVLFNIDAKGEATRGEAAVLDAFFRVFNHHRGRCSVNPDVAEFEDNLHSRGWLQPFINEFDSRCRVKWSGVRAYTLYTNEISASLQAIGGLSESEAKDLISSIKGMASISPAHFADLVSKHLESIGPKSRILFFADEAGQFIGKSPRLMLSLQTITEELGIKTKGRAWVVVTSQEDLEAVIGDLPEKKSNDFSKIQGRFRTKLKLSSSNADEVIQRRLLTKTGEAALAIQPHYDRLHDILRNAVNFKNSGMTFRQLGDSKGFLDEYPFLPYQFQLLPKIFTAIRKRGATGQHLAEGERSMLDAFQIAAKAVGNKEVGALVPLHGFYPAIESYLEGVVKRTIDQAPSRGIDQKGVDLLKTLFLIRWVEEVKGNVETLVTLSLTNMDEDRAKLKAEIEASLVKLESETLVNKSGENYYFLTDEEQAVDREIRQVNLQHGEESRSVGRTIFGDILTGQPKHRFSNGKDFTYARFCDGKPLQSAQGAELEVKVITSFNDEYEMYEGDAKAIMQSKADECLLIILPPDKTLSEEITKSLKVDTYLKASKSADLPRETKRIQEDRGKENGERIRSIITQLQKSFADARFYAGGQKFTPSSLDPAKILAEALESLINGSFSQLGLLKSLTDQPNAKLHTLLKRKDAQGVVVDIETSENREAIAAVKQKIDSMTSLSRQIVVSELVADFGRRPYGWSDGETILIIGSLIAAGQIQLLSQGIVLSPDQCFDPLSKPGYWKQTVIQKKQSLGEQELAQARTLAQSLFHSAVPSPAEDAVRQIRTELTRWQTAMNSAMPFVSQASRYPGKVVVHGILEAINPLLDEKDSKRFIDGFLLASDTLKSLQPKQDQVSGFYSSQRPVWEKMIEIYEKCRHNEAAIRDHDVSADQALAELRTIITSTDPYNRIPEGKMLADKVAAANKAVTEIAREAAKAAITEIQENLDQSITHLEDGEAAKLQEPLLKLKESVDYEEVTGNLSTVRERAAVLYNTIVDQINRMSPVTETQVIKAKPIKTIHPPAKTLETPAEVDAYLEDLKTQILNAIEKGEKVQVQ